MSPLTRIARRRAVGVTLAGVALAAVGGCSKADARLDDGAAQRVVAGAVADRLDPAVVGADCPEGLARRKGETFTCKVRLKGTDDTVRARAREVDDDGRLEVMLLDAVVSEKRVTEELKAQLDSRFGRSFQADCGDGFRIVTPGDTFRCQASDANGRKAVLITVTDAAGTLRFRVLP